jgi:hypothetical protein
MFCLDSAEDKFGDWECNSKTHISNIDTSFLSDETIVIK